MKMWSGRFRQELDPQFERWQRSFDFDRRLLRYELAASGAHSPNTDMHVLVECLAVMREQIEIVTN